MSSRKPLTVPSAKLKKYDCGSLFLAAPAIWNSLPKPIRSHDDISKYKTSTNTLLFKEHFN